MEEAQTAGGSVKFKSTVAEEAIRTGGEKSRGKNKRIKRGRRRGGGNGGERGGR